MQQTLKDVARESGYSLATVSRVLSGSNYPVSQKTRNAIEKKAREMGYVPNLIARGLRTNVSAEVAIIIPSVMNLYYSAMVMGAESFLIENGYGLIIFLVNDDTRASDVLVNVLSKRVAGVIIAADCISERNVPQLQRLRNENIPYVITDYEPGISESCTGVFVDYRKGCRMGMDYLVKKGHQDIAFLTMAIDRTSRIRRLEGYQDALRNNGLRLSEADVYISNCSSGFDAGRELADMMIESGHTYTAAMVNNDAVAVGVFSGLMQRHIRVPQDISVMGFDDCAFARMSSPLLTTIRVDAEQIGRQACEFLFAIKNGKKMDYSIFLEPTVVERDSVRQILRD